MRRAVIFDLDGTLWDSTEQVAAIWCDVFSKFEGVAVRPDAVLVASLMGKTQDEVGRTLFPEMCPADRDRIIDACGAAEIERLRITGGKLYPGVEQTLENLARKYLLIIVSNCQSGYVEAFLEAHGLERLFIDYEMNGRTGLTKADNIHLVIERNMIDKAVYVGDTDTDHTAALAAGIPFIHAAYGFGKIPEDCTCIDELAQLPEVAADILDR